MSLHVIAKICIGKRIVEYRVLDSTKKVSDTHFVVKDVPIERVKREYLLQREYILHNGTFINDILYDKDKEICGLYIRADRNSLRTNCKMPIIKKDKENQEYVENSNTLLEIQPFVFVDYTGELKKRKNSDETISVMSSRESKKRKMHAGKRNLVKYTNERKKRDAEKVGAVSLNEPLDLNECFWLYVLNELDNQKESLGIENLLVGLNIILGVTDNKDTHTSIHEHIQVLKKHRLVKTVSQTNFDGSRLTELIITQRGKSKANEARINLDKQIEKANNLLAKVKQRIDITVKNSTTS